MNEAEQILARLREKSRVTTRVGRYVGNEDQQALVDLGDQRFPVPFLTGFVPQVNDPVHVWTIDGTSFMVGPAHPKPGAGVVSTVNDPMVTVVTDFGTFSMPFAGATPTSGDTVGISWSSQPWCAKLSTSPEPPSPPDPPAPPRPEVKTAEFRVIDTGSTDRGSARWWQAQPWASDSTYGAWFYGHQIKDTVPAGAQFVSLEFYAAWAVRFGDTPRFTLHSDPYKAGVPAMTGPTAWAPGDGWQTPPDPQGWFNALKAGGDRFGVGLNQGGWNRFKSRGEDGMTGALRIKWK